MSQVLQCAFLIFHAFHCFSTYPRSYSELFSFSKFFSVSRHIPCHTVFISHFPHFSVFLAIFQVIKCVCLIFHVFLVSCHIPSPTVCISHFLCFSVFLALFQILKCPFLVGSRQHICHYKMALTAVF